MNRTTAVAVTVLAVAALTGCSTTAGSTGANSAQAPADYCTAIAPLWNPTAVPNYDEEMSGAERATAIAAMTTAMEALPQGVELGAITEAQADLLLKGLPVYLAMYENPDLADADPSAVASAAGLTVEEMQDLGSEENAATGDAAVQALSSYCKPSAAPSE